MDRHERLVGFLKVAADFQQLLAPQMKPTHMPPTAPMQGPPAPVTMPKPQLGAQVAPQIKPTHMPLPGAALKGPVIAAPPTAPPAPTKLACFLKVAFDYADILNYKPLDPANAGTNAIAGGVVGAIPGAAIGGISGLIAPGEDEMGNRRSRVRMALQRALMGGAVTGAAGALAGGHFPTSAGDTLVGKVNRTWDAEHSILSKIPMIANRAHGQVRQAVNDVPLGSILRAGGQIGGAALHGFAEGMNGQ